MQLLRLTRHSRLTRDESEPEPGAAGEDQGLMDEEEQPDMSATSNNRPPRLSI